MAASLKGWTTVRQESDETVQAACMDGDPFTLSGFAGNSTHDGCYIISCSNPNLRLYTLNGQDESLGGLIVSAPEQVESTYLVSPNVLGCLCLGAYVKRVRRYNESTPIFEITQEENATLVPVDDSSIGLGSLIMDGC